MANEHAYRAKLTWTGAEKGPVGDYESYSRDHLIEIPGKAPIKGSADGVFLGDSSLHNPEDLLVASLSVCHMLTYLARCAHAGIEVVAYEDDASGTLLLTGNGGHFTEAVLRPKVTIAASGDLAKALALHESAHKACFIGNSMNFPVSNEPQVIEAAAAA
jgi:organic hydroperoxide reductase OsmC/OhrA